MMSPLRSMTESEIVRELLALCAEAGHVERRLLLIFSGESDTGKPQELYERLCETIGGLSKEAKEVLLYTARRWVGGMREYGALDLATDRRQFALEAIAEDCDAAFYRLVAELKGRPDGFTDETVERYRAALVAALRRELV